MHMHADVVDHGGRLGSKSWVGVNFWSRGGGPSMWTQYDGMLVREELAVLARHGLNVTRSFCYWPAFMPEPEHLDEEVLDRFADFLDAHLEHGLGTIPTLLVGHMSGENWDPPWRGARDLYRDVWLVSQQAWFAAEIARRFGGHEAVVAWLVSNEMPLYGGEADSEDVTAWARILVQAIRSAGVTQPVSLGDGAWGVEVTGSDNGFSLRALSPLVDFLGPHSYPMDDDPVRLLLKPAFACELASSFGKPVVLEEFGVSSDFASDEHAAQHYRQLLHTTLLAGADGWLAWCNTDFELAHRDPYRHHPFELRFGVTDVRGRPKPVLYELERFSALLRQLGDSRLERAPREAAIVVPEHFERVLPFTEQRVRDDLAGNLLQAYVAAREADLPVELARERDGLDSGARLYLLPSVKALTAPGLIRLSRLATAGALLYASYFGGSSPNQRGPWLSRLDEVFGVRHGLRHGLVESVEDDDVVFRFVEPLGELDAGTTLHFRLGGSPSARACLPVEPAGATVLAVDGHGRPALLRHELGEGAAILCTYPIEHYAAQTPRANPEPTWRLYSALAAEAGVARPVRVNDPRVLVGTLGRRERTAILVNCSSDTVDADISFANGDTLEHTPSLRLDPYDVVALPIATRLTEPLIAATVGGSDADT